jgi:hypothetical protein
VHERIEQEGHLKAHPSATITHCDGRMAQEGIAVNGGINRRLVTLTSPPGYVVRETLLERYPIVSIEDGLRRG